MRYLPFLLLALPGSVPALAQTQPVSAPAVLAAAAPGAPAGPDTAAAIHRLFAHKRANGHLVVGTTLVAGSGMLYGATQAKDIGSGALLGVGCLAAVPVVLIEALVYHGRYGRRREAQALAAWQAHRLPPGLRKQLTSYYFPPAR